VVRDPSLQSPDRLDEAVHVLLDRVKIVFYRGDLRIQSGIVFAFPDSKGAKVQHPFDFRVECLRCLYNVGSGQLPQLRAPRSPVLSEDRTEAKTFHFEGCESS